MSRSVRSAPNNNFNHVVIRFTFTRSNLIVNQTILESLQINQSQFYAKRNIIINSVINYIQSFLCANKYNDQAYDI